MGIRPAKVPTVMDKFDIWCVRQVQHLLTDEDSINYLNTYEDYLNGTSTLEDVHLARTKDHSFEWEIVRAVLGTIIYGIDLPYLDENSLFKRIKKAHAEYVKSGKIPLFSVYPNEQNY